MLKPSFPMVLPMVFHLKSGGKFPDLQVGAIGTTFGTDASMAASDDGKWADNRRLNEDVAKRKGDGVGDLMVI
jgi:hypothetical protein